MQLNTLWPIFPLMKETIYTVFVGNSFWMPFPWPEQVPLSV